MVQHARFLLVLALVCTVLPAWSETLPSGTKLVVRLDRPIEPDGKTRQKFSASLSTPLFIDGRQVLPLGSRIEGDIRGSKKTVFLLPQKLILPNGKKLDFSASVQAISSKRLKAEAKEGTIEQKGGDRGAAAQQAGEIGSTGAVIGALSTGSLAGAGIGAAIGVGAVLLGRKIAGSKKATYIPAGSEITLSLNRSIDIPDSAANVPAPEMKITNPEDRRPILRREEPENDAPNTAANLLPAQ